MPLPFYVHIEPTTRCNLKCPYCTRGTYAPEDLKADISVDFVRQILENHNLRILKIQGMGEPFAYKSFQEISEMAFSKGVALETTTNGTTLLKNPNHRELLLNYYDRVNISIDAGTKETFEINRVGAKYNSVLNGLKLLVEEKTKKKSKLIISAAFVVTQDNYQEIPKFIKEMSKIGVTNLGFPIVENWKIPEDSDFKIFEKYYLDFEQKKPEIMSFLKERIDEDMLHQSGLIWQFSRGKRKGNCDWGFYNAFYTESGNLTPCCIRMENKYALRKSKDLKFSEIVNNWNSKELKEFRRSHILNTPNKYCDKCPG